MSHDGESRLPAVATAVTISTQSVLTNKRPFTFATTILCCCYWLVFCGDADGDRRSTLTIVPSASNFLGQFFLQYIPAAREGLGDKCNAVAHFTQ